MSEISTPWSPRVQDQINTVRKLPAQTIEEKSIKKEQAERLRLQTQLSTAAMMLETINMLGENPNLGPDEIVEQLKRDDKVTHEQGITQFAENLVEEKGYIIEALKELEDQGIPAAELATDIFLQIQRSNKPDTPPILPSEPIRLDTTYPAALVVHVHATDYKNIDALRQTDGFYCSNHALQVNDKKKVVIPIIVVTTDEALPHEKTHAENSITKDTLQNMHLHKKLWGSIYMGKKKEIDLGNALKSSEQIKDTQVEQATGYALGWAKDELLAAWGEDSAAKLQSMVKDDTNYDYFVQRLGIPKNSDIHKILWEKYKERLIIASSKIIELQQQYNDPRGKLHNRLRLLPFIFSQIPMESINEQIYIYEKEVQAHRGFIRRLENGVDLLPSEDEIELTEEEKNIKVALVNLQNDYLQQANATYDKTLYDCITEFSPKLTELEQRAQDSEAVQICICMKDITQIMRRAKYFTPDFFTYHKPTASVAADNETALYPEIEQIYKEYEDNLNSVSRMSLQQILEYKEKLEARIEILRKDYEDQN